MQICIDESGAFVAPKRPHRVSAVGALVIPDTQASELYDEFNALTTTWPSVGGEVKGSQLSETQISAVIELLLLYDVLFDVRAIDMGANDRPHVEKFQALQAAALSEHITAAHSEQWHEWGARAEQAMRRLPPQLFVQCMITIYLILDLVQAVTLYYAQRRPTELGHFQWRIDPKDRNKRTDMEKLWPDVIFPMNQTQSLERPFITLENTDYSHFERYYMPRENMPPGLREHVGPGPRDGGLDFEKILLDDFDFPDSRDHTGLRIVDILVNAYCRALNGNLAKKGWESLGGLMTTTENARSRIVFFRTSKTQKPPDAYPAHLDVLRAFDERERDILTPDRRAG